MNDPNVLGDSPCAINLAHMLDDLDPYVARRVMASCHKYHWRLAELRRYTPLGNFYKNVLLLLRKQQEENIYELVDRYDLPSDFLSHLLNHTVAMGRKSLVRDLPPLVMGD